MIKLRILNRTGRKDTIQLIDEENCVVVDIINFLGECCDYSNAQFFKGVSEDNFPLDEAKIFFELSTDLFNLKKIKELENWSFDPNTKNVNHLDLIKENVNWGESKLFINIKHIDGSVGTCLIKCQNSGYYIANYNTHNDLAEFKYNEKIYKINKLINKFMLFNNHGAESSITDTLKTFTNKILELQPNFPIKILNDILDANLRPLENIELQMQFEDGLSDSNEISFLMDIGLVVEVKLYCLETVYIVPTKYRKLISFIDDSLKPKKRNKHGT